MQCDDGKIVETSTGPDVGRRALLGGAVALTVGIGALALTDTVPFVGEVVPFVDRDVELTWLVTRLRDEAGLATRPAEGWQDRSRPRSFRPSGVLIHHTGFRATANDPHPALETVLRGRAGLPGPLCHVLVDRTGACHVLASGRANHAGEARASGPMPAGDGNTAYVGIEIDYAPQEPFGQQPTADQGLAAVAAAAAIVSRLGNGADRVRYHSETSTAGKWDPGNTVDADEFRTRVDAELVRRWA